MPGFNSAAVFEAGKQKAYDENVLLYLSTQEILSVKHETHKQAALLPQQALYLVLFILLLTDKLSSLFGKNPHYPVEECFEKNKGSLCTQLCS